MKRLKGLRVVVLAAGLAMLAVSVAQAAPIGTLKQFRVPTNSSSPKNITQGSDGNFWFTEAFVNPPQQNNQNVAPVEPFGITVAPDGSPWYCELSANKIAVLSLK